MSNRTTTLTGKPVIYFAAALTVVIGALAPAAAHAQAASEVYRRMSDTYSFAKSYQGTIVRVEKGKTPDGTPASQTVTVKISFKAPNKYLVNNVRSATVGAKSERSDQTMVTDGKTSFTFYPEQKVYQRGRIQNENLLSRFFAQINPVNGFSLLPESTVNGRAAFVLKPSLPVNGTPTQIANAKKLKITLMIDKQNYQLLKMTIESPNGNLAETTSGQVMNGPVPDSLFTWTPPAGYKEVKPQTVPSSGPAVPGRPVGR